MAKVITSGSNRWDYRNGQGTIEIELQVRKGQAVNGISGVGLKLIYGWGQKKSLARQNLDGIPANPSLAARKTFDELVDEMYNAPEFPKELKEQGRIRAWLKDLFQHLWEDHAQKLRNIK